MRSRDFQKIFKIFNWKLRNFHAWLRKNCNLYQNNDWRIWKRVSRSRRECLMKVYWYGYKMGFHNSSKLVKSAIIPNQKPLIVLKQFLYNIHFFDTWFWKEFLILFCFLYKNSLNTIDGFWFWFIADFTNLVES